MLQGLQGLAMSKVEACLTLAADPAAVVQGKRTLDFVLKNQGFVDKTLLFDIELMKIVQ